MYHKNIEKVLSKIKPDDIVLDVGGWAPDETIAFLFWEDTFDFTEKRIDGGDNIYEELSQFVASRYKYPKYMYFFQKLTREGNRIVKGIKRRLFI